MAAPRSRTVGKHGRSEVWSRPVLRKAFERSKKRLGVRLKEIREERGLTQEQAAELAGLHAKHIGVVESGKTNATFGTLVALAFAYCVSLAAFFEGAPVIR